MIRYLQETPIYSNYWGVFYALFWVIAPIFLILGFVSSFFLSEKGLDALREKTWLKLVIAFFFLMAITLFGFTVPEVGTKPWFDETSSNVVILAFTCLEISGCHHGLGLIVGLIRIKSSRKFS